MSSTTTNTAARLKKPSWKDPRLLVGILLVLCSVAGVVALITSMDRTTEVFVANAPIAVGQKVDAGSLGRAKVQLGDTQDSYILASDGVPESSIATRMIPKGQLLPKDSVGHADALDRKPVAITIDQALPAQAVVGSHVDVWVAMPDTRNGYQEPQLLLPGAEIGDIVASSQSLGSSSAKSVLVLVSDAQMPKLLGAQANKAKISVVWDPAGGVK
ncbi:hypothetical protein ACQR35_03385 [Pseudarthrobacter sp. J1738]|uniref:hypothetical protein n=1 Tax=Pseudarthrobacter sp. J1738 TaxID=3420446 RepID=UPI003D2E73CF